MFQKCLAHYTLRKRKLKRAETQAIRTVSLIQTRVSVLFMDTNLIETHHFIKTVKALALFMLVCKLCEQRCAQLWWKQYAALFIAQALVGEFWDQNGAQLSTAFFILFFWDLFSQLPWQNAFKALQWEVRIIFNELHLPTNHKTIKTEHKRYKQTYYAELSEKIPSVLHQ